jgi:LysR family glycine cleavage system transcriptional activator
MTALRRRLPPLNALRAFEAVARHLNITQAADELSVTPGAVSQQVQNLEDYLGVTLFRRTPKGLSLTDSAQSAVPVLHEAFERLAEATSILQPSKDPQRLTVSAAPSFAAKWLTPRLARFNEQHPDIDIWLSASMELVDFSKADVDLAIRYGRGGYVGVETRRLMSEMVVPVVSPTLLQSAPLASPAGLAEYVLLHDESPDADPSCPSWAMWLAARGIRDVDGSRGPRFNQSSLVIEAAVAGRGIALAKRALAQEDIAAGRLVTPFEIETAVEFAYYLVYPRKSGWRPQVKAFLAWLAAEARDSD